MTTAERSARYRAKQNATDRAANRAKIASDLRAIKEATCPAPY